MKKSAHGYIIFASPAAQRARRKKGRKKKRTEREREKGGGKEKNKRIKKIHREETATNLHVESVHACLGLNERQRRAEKVTF